jgi:membrane associated rhomboid family serine protease
VVLFPPPVGIEPPSPNNFWRVSEKLLWLFMSIFIPCAVIFVLGQESTDMIRLLRFSPSTPYGVFTAIFVHERLGHFLENMAGLATFLFAFAMVEAETSFFGQLREPKRGTLFPLSVLLISALVANVVVVLLKPDASPFGASGVVFATTGAVCGLALYGAFHYAATRRLGPAVINLVLAVVFFVSTVATFGSPEVANVAGHIVAFLTSTGIITLAYLVVARTPDSRAIKPLG